MNKIEFKNWLNEIKSEDKDGIIYLKDSHSFIAEHDTKSGMNLFHKDNYYYNLTNEAQKDIIFEMLLVAVNNYKYQLSMAIDYNEMRTNPLNY